jgi:undecaprenyl diphosphate synthase
LSSKLNFKRKAEDIDAFCKYGYEICRNILPAIVNKYNTAVIPVGDLSLLPSYFSDELIRLKNLSNSNIQTKLYVVVAYNPIDEIVDAFMQTKDSNNFLESLWVREPLNILIRTGNSNTISHFLPLQSASAQLYFINKLFPDTTTDEVLNIVHQYRQLNLRYGK